MKDFKDFFKPKITEPVKKRHMHPIGRDPISHPLSPGKFVPDMWRSNNDVVPEFEALKKMQSGQKVINNKKAAKLRAMFPLKKDGKLGNTGISMIKNPSNPSTFILQK